MRRLAGQPGAFEGVRLEGAGYAAVFEKGEVPVRITLDAQGRIAGLFFGPPRPRPARRAAPEKRMVALAGKKSLLVLNGGEALAALDPGARLAAGSAFKLSVLAALLDRIEAGELSWETTVPLKDAWKSLPLRCPGGPARRHPGHARVAGGADDRGERQRRHRPPDPPPGA